MGVSKTAPASARHLPKALTNIHLWITLALFLASIALHYPQLIPFLGPIEPDSFLDFTRHSVGRLFLLLPISYTALVFGIRIGMVSLVVAFLIMIPNVFILSQITADDLVEIIGIFILGLVVNFWLDSYETDKRHRQQAYLSLETTQRELERMQQNLRFYLKQITIAQEDERQRIAQELHDDTAQDLIVLSRKLDSFISRHKSLPAEDIAYLEELHQQTDRTLSEVRRFSQDLRPSVLDDLGLLPALEWLIPQLKQHFDLEIDMKVLGTIRRFPPETELVLFRIVQEALRNIGKHAAATEAKVTLSFNTTKTILTIKDNGKGFKLPQRIGDLAALGKLGLVGMQERARLTGGKLRVKSKPGVGTTVKVEVPQPKQPPPKT